MELLINAVEFVAFCTIVIEINFCIAMTIDTPAHAQLRKLFHFIHFRNISMTGLALNIACFYVLGMIEVNMVRQVVDPYPFNWFGFGRIPIIWFGRIETRIFVEFGDLSRTIYFLSFIII